MTNRAFLLLALLTAGCFDEGMEEEEVSSVRGAIASTNSLTTNSLTTNALTTNSLTTNSLTTNSLTTNGLSSTSKSVIQNDPTFRKFFSYMYACAMMPGTSLTVGAYTFQGDLGLAPEWGSSSCGGSCQRWVSACVFARVNEAGERQLISMRKPAGYGNASSPVSNVSATEKAQFPVREGAFYGNLWAKTPGGKVPMYRCIDLAILRNRAGSGLPSVGWCNEFSWGGNAQYANQASKACTVDSGGTYRGCGNYDVYDNVPSQYGTDGKYGVYDEVITIYRADPNVQAAAHVDYVAGAAIPQQVSPCAWKIGQMDPYCSNNAWDATCVWEAQQYCGDHSVCTTGAALVGNDSECINAVVYGPAGVADPYCKDSAWDGQCVAEAKARCSLTCQ